MSPTVRLTPSLTPPSPTTNGTTRITTSGAPRLGPRARTHTVHPPTARPLPLDTVPRPLLTTALPKTATETMPGPSSLTALVPTPDTANLTIPLMPSPTTTSPTQRRPRPPIDSGLKATNQKRKKSTRAISTMMNTRRSPRKITTPGEEIKNTKRISHTIRLTLNPTVLSLTMNGTTPTTTSMEPNLGARERMPTAPLLTANPPPPERASPTAMTKRTTLTMKRPLTTTTPPGIPRTLTLGPRLATVPTRTPDTASLTTP